MHVMLLLPSWMINMLFIDAMLLSIFHYFVYVLKIVHRCFMVTTYEFLKPLSSHDRQALRRIRK